MCLRCDPRWVAQPSIVRIVRGCVSVLCVYACKHLCVCAWGMGVCLKIWVWGCMCLSGGLCMSSC